MLLKDRTGQYDRGLVFIDRETEPGTDWTRQIREALRTCRVFFSVESPAYFQSEYCGKEWNAFRNRLDEYVRATRRAAPPVHIRIPWLPVSENLLRNIPRAVRAIQDSQEALGSYAKKGFEELLRRNLEEEYQTALTRLADLASNAWEKYALPPSKEIPDLSLTQSAFSFLEQVAAEQPDVGGVGHVRIGVVAAVLEEVRSLRDCLDSYGNGSVDWKPFHPAASKRIGPFAQGVAASQNLTSTYLEMDDSLPLQLSQAERARNVVVFLVDPWTLEMEKYRAHVTCYDDQHFLNCALLIPWPSDTQTKTWKARLFDRVRATLAKTAQREPGAYREDIDSLARLEAELIKAITSATTRVVEFMEVTRRVDSNWTITMPLISGPAGVSDAR